MAVGLDTLAASFTAEQHEFAPRLNAAVAASPELRERDALKAIGLAAAMTTALTDRGVPDPAARLAAEMGVLAVKQGFAQWADGGRDDGGTLGRLMRAALEEMRVAAASLGAAGTRLRGAGRTTISS